MGMVYAGLGSKVTMVDISPRLLDGADHDLVDIMVKHSEEEFEEIRYDSKTVDIREAGDGFEVDIEHEGEVTTGRWDRVLVAIGRRPNTDDLGLEHTAIEGDERGLIPVDETMRTVVPHIFAIGDVVPGPPLAHKASREGKVAAEAAAGHVSAFDNRAIPAVVFTDPEIAWTGLTEREAETQGIAINVGRFPLRALGRARTMGRIEGLVKIISDPESDLVLGVGMVGPHVSELIAEGTLAIEMGATLEDLMVTVHPHPTLSEAIMEAAEVAAGAPIHIPPASKQQ
jgi:dihydrolipoamide dehydrogenase